jgi:DNA-binding GntR family transcriptional regulator
MVRSTLTRGVRERVVNQLREDILSRRLAEGERLSEMELAKRFGVSRGPIREAFVQLTHEGLLVAQPNRGVRVATSAPNSIRKLVTPIRRTLETYALDSIFDDLDEDDFRVLEGVLERMRLACERGDIPATIEPDIAFHRFLLERAGQPDLVVIWSTIIARIRRHLEQVHRDHTFSPLDVYHRHRDLVEVFRTGDRSAAVKALQEHIV